MKRMICLLMGVLVAFMFTLSLSAQEAKKEEPKKEEPKAEGQKAADEEVPKPPERPKSLEEAVQKADIIFVGLVDYVGDKPTSWGNPPFRPNTQYIRYVDVKFLKGQYPSKRLMVIHELFKGSKTAAETPGLDPKVFDIDKKVIVLVNTLPYSTEGAQQPVTFMPTDPDFGAMAWSEECEKKITSLIK